MRESLTSTEGQEMTRKDYEAMAQDIKHTIEHLEGDYSPSRVFLLFLENFTEYMKEDNPKFDISKFFKACGLDRD